MRKTQHITSGAMTLGLMALLIVLDRVSLGTVMSFLALPLVVYGAFYDFKATSVVYGASIVLAFVLTGYLPTVIMMAGYGLVGLVLVYANQRKFSKPLTYGLMYLASIPVYVVMIRFFGDYFGVNIPQTLELLNSMVPADYDPQAVRNIAMLSIALLPLMEAFIMKISSQLVLTALMRSDKFKSHSNKS